MLGVFSFPWIVLTKRFGRLPILFWSMLGGLGFLIGCSVSPTIGSFAACRILAAVFQTAPQITGLYVICDMFPFHLQARKINLWNLGFIVSPFIGPSILGFMVTRTSWRWVYGVGCIYNGIVLILIVLFMQETMYERHISPVPPRPAGTGIAARLPTLLGISGARMAKYHDTWGEAIFDIFNIVWRPQALLPSILIMAIFGFGIGINVTNAVFVGSPPPVGYGLTGDQQAGTYFSPVFGVLVGELVGHYFNDITAYRLIKRNKGVFEAEMRLWTLYVAMPFFVAGFITLGECFEYKLNVGGLVMGWFLAEFGILLSTVCIYNYLNNCFPAYNGEVSAIVNFWRTLGGFAVPYFQVDWATANGAVQTFGVEAAISLGLFLLIIPLLQLKGRTIRHNFQVVPRRNKRVL